MSFEGSAFVVITFLIGVAAMNTGAQLLFLVFSMLCSFWILSAVLATSSLRGLSLQRIAPRTAMAGQPLEATVRARNHKPRSASYSLRVMDRFADGGCAGVAFFARVPPGGPSDAAYRRVFLRRGLQKFASLEAATRFPFGLVERRIVIDSPHEVLVLPAIIDVGRFMDRTRAELGEEEAQAKGRGAGLYGLRAYVEGESARDIHWKVSARTGSLMVREYESEERRRVTVILDNRRPASAPDDWPAQFEKAIILAHSVVSVLTERGRQVELLTASGRVPFGSGAPHRMRCGRALALLNPESATSRPPRAHEPRADSVQLDILYHDGQGSSPEALRLATSEYDDLLEKALAAPGEASP